MENKKKLTAETSASIKERVVSIYIPSDGTGAFLEGALNGVSFRIPTDTVVEIPERIAKVIAESRIQIRKGVCAAEAYTGVGGRKIG